MAQKTDLNISPFYDDFEGSKNYYKVLFKPGYPVQARELTTLQSILQNQVESFGSHMFKEGSIVIPGNVVYDDQFSAVKLNTTTFGTEISLYLKDFIGKTITGDTSGSTATIQFVALPEDGEVDYPTIYVKYIDSDKNFVFNEFEDGESLSCNENIVYGNTTINAGTPFSSLTSADATSTGSAVSIGDGVFFVRGYFVDIVKQTIILDHYTNSPSYRIGLKVDEEIISAKDDPSLYDNAKGFTNYAAPGADRLKLSLTLTKKVLTDTNDTDFIELLRVDNGTLKKVNVKTSYNLIRDYMAKRTYDESGDYSVSPFETSTHNSLNDRLGNSGLFVAGEKTDELNTPSDDLMCVKVSPGTAYVRGYEAENEVTTILDIEKPRDTQTIPTSNIAFEMGNIVRVNNVNGVPAQRYSVDLNDQIGGIGQTIGRGRVYNFNLSDSSWTGSSSNWDIHLYDLQTYTHIGINTTISSTDLPVTSFVKGKSSGAIGYAVDAGADSSTIKLSQTSGVFSVGEQLIVNGIDFPRTINSVTAYGTDDIRSFKQLIGAGTVYPEFSADSVLEKSAFPNNVIGGSLQATITIGGAGISTLTSPGQTFTGVDVGDIVRYQRAGYDNETYNRVNSVASDGLSLTVAGITTVTGVFDGGLPADAIQPTVSLSSPSLRNRDAGALYAQLPDENISSVNLTNSTLMVTDQLTNQAVTGQEVTIQSSAFTGITSAFFASFDEERYSAVYTSGGGIATVTSDRFALNASGSEATFSGISGGTNVVISATLLKNGIQSKLKQYNRSQELVVNLSKFSESGTSASASINDGLTYNRYYGLRVQDEEVSLNYPDVSKVLAVYESLDSTDPTLDTIQCNATAAVSTNAIIGENIIGETSKAVCRIVSSPSTNKLRVVYLNTDRLIAGEVITFDESNIKTEIEAITLGNYKNITSAFTLDKGQKDQFYDYSRLVRKGSSSIPARRLLVVFDHYTVPTDTGDVFTVLSYDKDRFANDIPEIGPNRVRATDTLDFRPRVSYFSGTSSSPFDFISRDFDTVPKLLLAPNESSLLGYDYYLGRIDRLYLDKFGSFILEKGVSEITPKPPTNNDEVMTVATITLPPYLYDPSDAEISLVDNRRYTMKDIGLLEDRVENLERVTSLSLLEVGTQSLQIRDHQGNERFKSGFFVDDFKNRSLMNLNVSSVDIDQAKGELIPAIAGNSLNMELAVSSDLDVNSLDFSTNFNLLDSNVQKTGNAVTLKYDEVDWIEQPLATRVENVNPFNVIQYTGNVQLSPSSDSWTRIIRLADRTVNVRRNVTIDSGSGNAIADTRVTFETTSDTRDNLLSSGTERWIRSRNTEYSVDNLKPLTRYYQFFDGNGNIDFVPKLLEIATDSTLQTYGASGAFAVGETVVGTSGNGDNLIRFRVADANHKTGSYNDPSTVFNINPYNKSENLATSYSQSSKVLNIDTFSLSQAPDSPGDYSGYVTTGMMLVGQTSGAVAYVKDLRLISDNYGDLIGTFFLRNPHSDPPPTQRISTGSKTFKVTNSSVNAKAKLGSKLLSTAEAVYVSTGTWRRRERVTTNTTIRTNTRFWVRRDPLAQTFTVGGNILPSSTFDVTEDQEGAFVTSVDIFFATKPTNGNNPVTVEIRNTQLGTPADLVLGNSVTLLPSDVTTSLTGEIATKFTFPEPIYLEPGNEYSVVILAETTDQYEVWIAEMGETTVNTQSLPDTESVRYAQQWAMGSLFKSQNGSVWSPNQYQDLKFKLYKAKFTSTSGTAFFYNPPLNKSNDYIQELDVNALTTKPKTATLGISTIFAATATSHISDLASGRKIAASASDGYGYVVGAGSSVTTVELTTAGSNYIADTDVQTYNIVGSGSDLRLNISVDSNGGISGVPTIVDSGNGYKVGDIVGIVTSSVSSATGRNATITISAAPNLDTLYLSGIQGSSFNVGMGLTYYDNSGSAVSLASTTIRSYAENGGVDGGSYIKVNHFNHGMYGNTNVLSLSDIDTSAVSTNLSAQLLLTDVSSISVASTSGFATFEGVAVGSGNPGYVKINNEIISYESVGTGTLDTLDRGIDSTVTVTHNQNNILQKYELNGISLRRISGVSTDISDTDIGIDDYYVEINRAANGTNRSSDATSPFPEISFANEASVGGSNIRASENILYNEVLPLYEILTPSSATNVTGSIRTISGTSVDGTETSFIDKGFESVELNELNKLDSVRIVCSQVNENQYLTDLPSKKSFTTGITLSSNNPNLSPLVYSDTPSVLFRSSRLNDPIANYTTDNRVNSLIDDPNAAIYVSNTVNLTQPASSLKVILAAYRHSSADIRVLYNLIRADSAGVNPEFELFPGYDNLAFSNTLGYTVVDAAKNTGRSDAFVRPSLEDEFLEYQYTADDIGLFTGYTIKIIMSGTNQAYPPRIKDFRSIATR